MAQSTSALTHKDIENIFLFNSSLGSVAPDGVQWGGASARPLVHPTAIVGFWLLLRLGEERLVRTRDMTIKAGKPSVLVIERQKQKALKTSELLFWKETSLKNRKPA